MNMRFKLRFRMKDAQRAGVGEVSVFRAQDRDAAAIRLCVFAEIDRGRARRVDAWRVTRIGEKGDVPFGGFVEPGGAEDFDVGAFSYPTRAGQFSKLTKFHKEPHIMDTGSISRLTERRFRPFSAADLSAASATSRRCRRLRDLSRS